MSIKIFGGWECERCGRMFAYAWAIAKHEREHVEEQRVGGID